MININNTIWNDLSYDDIEKHVASDDGENFFFEYKDDRVDIHKIAAEISAFANTYGGYIFLGVSDDKEILGCNNWTEEKIHGVIHDCITPIPIFGIRRFVSSQGKIILVIRVEEGNEPPYITNKGKIYQRLSSGSYVIKEASTLTQLFYKKRDNEKRILDKNTIEDIDPSNAPGNLAGYVDVGFSLNAMDKDAIYYKLCDADYNRISEFLKKFNSPYSISKCGVSLIISFGKIAMSNNSQRVLSSLNDFMEIKGDGSVKYRSILFYSNDDNTVDISLVIASVHIFSEIYKIIFGDIILDNFISIEKYEKLTVLKQFSPRFLNNVPVYSEMLLKHRESYGDNIMISSNRLPSSGLRTYDKRYFSEFGIDYNVDNVVDEFFKTLYAVMGFIDKPNNAINSNDSSTKIFSTEQL